MSPIHLVFPIPIMFAKIPPLSVGRSFLYSMYASHRWYGVNSIARSHCGGSVSDWPFLNSSMGMPQKSAASSHSSGVQCSISKPTRSFSASAVLGYMSVSWTMVNGLLPYTYLAFSKA
jgi:hypothetical protein